MRSVNSAQDEIDSSDSDDQKEFQNSPNEIKKGLMYILKKKGINKISQKNLCQIVDQLNKNFSEKPFSIQIQSEDPQLEKIEIICIQEPNGNTELIMMAKIFQIFKIIKQFKSLGK